MTLSFAKRTASDIKGIIGQRMGGVHDDLPLQMALAADHIRSALYGHAVSMAGTGGAEALHTTRLLTSVRKTLDFLWPGTSTHRLPGAKDDIAQHALDQMSLAGDIAETGGGFWIGTPFRLVRLDEAASFLLAGALPNAVVNEIIGTAPICAGVARFCAVPDPNPAEQLEFDDVQLIEDWFGAIEPLREWTERLLAKYEPRLAADHDLASDQLEVYAPDVFHAERKRGRWLPVRQASRALNGIRLCRPLSHFAHDWDRPYYLARFNATSEVNAVARSAPIPPDSTLRLRLGLDQILGAPRTAVITVAADTCEWEVPYGLPLPEARVLALSWPSHSSPGRRVFSKRALPALEYAFQRLSVHLIVRRRGTHA